MKKIRKKQMIIIGLAILLIIIILATFLILRVVNKNSKIADNSYFYYIENANSNLVASYIKEGISIGGITGTLQVLDTSDATATASDIINGKTAYSKGSKITGNYVPLNTSDATATANDILSGKTAYVNGVKITGTRDLKTTVADKGSYVGYYADINDDGDPEGVIYADLAVGKEGMWVNGNGAYVINKSSNFKEYYISDNTYNGPFGKKEILSPKGTGNNRFYIMALSDFSSSQYKFYGNGWPNMGDYASTTSLDFGKGKSNTNAMINKWNNSSYGSQSSDDMWKYLQSQYKSGWFVPSRAEWAAFCNEMGLTENNYSSHGMRERYWSSSQQSNGGAWILQFQSGYTYMDNYLVYGTAYVRLSTTF